MFQPDSNGWVPVEKKEIVIGDEDEVDESGIWPLFSLSMEGEKFWARFPSEPVYRYRNEGVDLQAQTDEAAFHLIVAKKRKRAWTKTYFQERKKALKEFEILEEAFDNELGVFHFVYKDHEKWVREDVILTPYYLYTFETKGDCDQTILHERFIASLHTFPLR